MEPEKPQKTEKPPERKRSANEMFLENFGKSGNKSQSGTSSQSKNESKLSVQPANQSKPSAQSVDKSDNLKQSGNATVITDCDVPQNSSSILSPDVSMNGQYILYDATASKYKLQCMTWLEMLKDQRSVSLPFYNLIHF